MEHARRTRVPSLSLFSVLNGNIDSHKLLCDSLRSDGFVVFNVEECKDVMELMKQFRTTIRDYFDSKEKQIGNFDHDIGYVNVENSREIFQVRLTNSQLIHWPSDSFREMAIVWYQLMTKIVTKLLYIITRDLGNFFTDIVTDLLGISDSSSIWDPILDPPFEADSPESFMTTSLLRIIHYFNSEQNNSAVYLDHHCDIGLLTLLPVAEIPGLEGSHSSDFLLTISHANIRFRMDRHRSLCFGSFSPYSTNCR
jgi:isopenicillin N synthase-like dioxygenase